MDMYGKVLVPLDGSELAESVFPHIKAISNSCRPGGMVFVRVVEPILWPVNPGIDISPEVAQKIESEQRQDAQEYLHRVADQFSREGVGVATELLFGYAADAIGAYADANAVDLIVLATHGRSGLGRWVWGSVADRLMRSSCVPVMMVRAAHCAGKGAQPKRAASTVG
ncbi:MAG: universal stress protein [Chloroflexi bacterium]|nr:universal stress protein [Chloroflexota bacterium]